MRKAARGAEMAMLPEYDFRGGIRGKYAARMAAGSNVVVLDPDVAVIFPNSKAVNDALRMLAKIARSRASVRSARRRKKA